jgi:hypothetical protein
MLRSFVSLRPSRVVRTLAIISTVAIAVVVFPSTPAGAAFGPNLLVNGSFEIPATPAGTASPPYGTCGTVVSFDLNGLIGQTNEGCWTLLGVGTVVVDRTVAKAGKQSVAVEAAGQNLVLLAQAVPAGPGSYRLSFQSTPERFPGPITMNVWSMAAGTTTQSSSVQFGPPAVTVDGVGVRTWVHYNVDITAPVGTDHLLVGVFDLHTQFSGGGSARFDAITLKQKL